MENIEQLIEQAIAQNIHIGSVGTLYEPIEYILRDGGKRIRPRLAILAGELFGGQIGQIMPSAVAVEVFHNFTLLHDDIMDNASTRRGRDTVHVKWDENRAILSGDAMMIMAYRILAGSEPDKLASLLAIFNKAAIEVCEGQQLDMEFEKEAAVTIAQYTNMIRLKTAVLMAGAMQMGAVAAGASTAQCEAMYRYGENLGMAFQIQDDILDTYGDSATFGKNIGGDIAEGKQTFLKITAVSLACSADCDVLSKSREYNVVRAIYDKYNVLSVAQKAVEQYFVAASKELAAFDSQKNKKLNDYANTLLNRAK